MELLGGRKFIFAMTALFLSFIMVMAKLVSASDWQGFVAILGITYITGNVMEHRAENK